MDGFSTQVVATSLPVSLRDADPAGDVPAIRLVLLPVRLAELSLLVPDENATVSPREAGVREHPEVTEQDRFTGDETEPANVEGVRE